MSKVLICLAILAFSVIAMADDIDMMPWGMYQNNPSHNGYIDTQIDVKAFSFDWKTFVGTNPNGVVNYLSQPVVDGNLVYVSRSNYVYSNSLQAFSIHDGHQIWRKDYGNVMINPPSVVNGIVYVQTVNNYSSDTALYGYDANSGKILFKAPTSAQWEHYLAPTIFAGQVYVDGGTYGGMYSFNATTGDNNWFANLAQYDGWTPAVNTLYAIAYTGGNLNVLNRTTGKTQVNIADPHFQWSGYTTGFAPVLVSDNEVLGLQSGYLSLFNIANKNITWAVGPGYVGQPTFDGKFIYASQNDGLVALDTTGKIAWKWFQDNENVLGQMLVTQNLIFVSTNKKVYALSKDTHEPVWSYPASGTISMGMGHLYILDYLGNLTSINVSSTVN